ncbi:MAG: (2Fe-2S) ferredoxin domain-containing protein [Bacteroidales bacterium]|nr:(2Fe-2S) ferredoxin domain-containing protein [Bacteroidales bacterium]
MLNKRNLKICMGSSCFSRGNSELIAEIRKFIRTHNLEDKVSFMGDHCFSECSKGPNLKIGEKIFHQVSSENLSNILKTELSDLI